MTAEQRAWEVISHAVVADDEVIERAEDATDRVTWRPRRKVERATIDRVIDVVGPVTRATGEQVRAALEAAAAGGAP